jgi:sialate O-acetylesterase
MEAGGPFEMRIEGKDKILLRDILVGEVWLASGQSNMWWEVKLALNPEKEIADSNYPEIRLFTVKEVISDRADLARAHQIGKPRFGEFDFRNAPDRPWAAASAETVANFSAVAYFFGRELYKHLKVPVGLIHCSWAGSQAEPWVRKETLESDLSLQPILWNWKKVLLDYPYALERYQNQLRDWEKESARAKSEGKAEPPRPVPPLDAGARQAPSRLFDTMIAPLTDFAIRGVIWYQGESNAEPYRSLEYRRLFPVVIADWRGAWDQGPFPFLFVQLANYEWNYSIRKEGQPSESVWAELQEAQRMASTLPNTGMAVTIDVGEARDIHPQNKQEVGHRLALLARAIAYGEEVVRSGPMYVGIVIESNRMRVRFDHVGSGLTAKGGTLKSFAIAGPDRKFVWADASIEGKTVVVSSPQVPHPVAVRYAWGDNPEASLYNVEGLPASPFRTDDWLQLSTP